MTCYYPIKGYVSRVPSGSGRFPIVFDRRKSNGQAQEVPCGQCIGCRLDRSRQWAMRCVHEASLYESNCFITLTYDPQHLPSDGSLCKSHFQLFMKRLRKKFSDSPIRYYHCGEYGAKLGRPHYHACLFNFDFLDKVFFKRVGDERLYVSEVLESVWGKGFCTVGSVTFESAAYVARYIMKKVNGENAAKHYEHFDLETGEVSVLQSEYTTMSRRPGIGRAWYELWKSDVYPDDFVVLRGRKMVPPRYYDHLYEVDDPEEYARLKRERRVAVDKDNCTPERLAVREKVKQAQVGFLKRGIEDDF